MYRPDPWITPFLSLELLGGTLIPLVNDDEDMLEIRWTDGMWIDVGFLEKDGAYYITTVAQDTPESWDAPLSVITVKDRGELPAVLQREIIRCRL